MDFSGATILVLGDVMLDHYISGDASRVSPEAPVPVVARRRAWTSPGGAANVARSLARLGCQVSLTGLVGMDAAGESLKRELGAEGVHCGLAQSRRRPTTCKTRIIANGQQLLRVDEERDFPPDLEESVALRLNFEQLLPGCSAIVLSDYAKGVLLNGPEGRNLCALAIGRARAAGIPVLVDPKGMDWEKYEGADCVTPNMVEFVKICGTLPQGDALARDSRARQALAEAIKEKYHFKSLLLTAGPKGMILYDADGSATRIRAARREVADVSGAGDAVIAALAACVAGGLSLKESAFIANAAAGVAVSKLGTAPVSISELNEALERGKENPKLMRLPETLAKIAEWRSQGQKIVFTNGCFDLLHPGHIEILRKSASFGDRLVVGLNSDSSVKRLKGPERPIQDQESRALLLGALKDVDAVVIFEEDTPEKLIHAIRPDVLVKGGDYKLANIVGADFVASYGGQTRIVDLLDGFGTTRIVERLRKGEKCP